MAEYGNNYDYGDSPFYKDEEQPPDGDDSTAIVSGANVMAVIIVSV